MFHENTGHGVSIHQYGLNVGTGNATIDTAAFNWLRAEHAGRPWLLDGKRPDGTQRIYNVEGPVGSWGIPGQILFGNGARINQLDPNEHVWRFGDVSSQGNHIYDVTLSTPDNLAHTKAGLGVLGNCSQSQIRNVFTFRVFDGMAMDVGDGGAGSYVGFFSNTINNLRGLDIKGMPLRMETQNGGSTGNHFQNVYFSNATAADRSCERLFWFRIFWGNSFNQINFERMNPTDPALLQQAFGQVFDSFYTEEVVIPFSGLVQVFSPGSTVDFRGFNHLNSSFGFANSPLFSVGEDVEINVDSGIWNSSSGVQGVPAWAAGTVNESKVRFRDFRDESNGIVVAGATIPDRTFLQWNEDWHTIFDGADRYRVTAPGGALTTNLV